MSEFAAEVASKVRGLIAESEGVTQEKIALAIGKSQGYVSPRINGKEAWNTRELDILAALLGMSGIELIQEVMKRGDFRLAAQEGHEEPGDESV